MQINRNWTNIEQILLDEMSKYYLEETKDELFWVVQYPWSCHKQPELSGQNSKEWRNKLRNARIWINRHGKTKREACSKSEIDLLFG